MKISNTLTFLSILVAVLAAAYAGIGLFSKGGEGPFEFTSLHGQNVEIYGQGIYRNDASFRAPIFRGTDAVTLFICVPVLLLALISYRRGSLRGRLLLTGTLAYFLYNSASLTFGAAYNNILLIYIASFSVSLFAFVLAISSIDLGTLAARTAAKLPRVWIAIFLFLAGMSVMVWLIEIIGALVSNGVPANLGPYSTEATYAVDLGVILPTAFLAAILVLRHSPLGTLLAYILITVNIFIGLVVASQSIVQALDGIILTPAQYAAYVAPFVTMSVIAIWLIIAIQHNISDS